MPHPIRFWTHDEEYWLLLSAIDKRIFSVVEGRVLPETGSLLQGVLWGTTGVRLRSLPVPRGPLLDEVRAVVNEIERDSELLPYAYTHSYTTTDSAGNIFYCSGSGGSHGRRLAGDPDHIYGITTGIGVCDLEKWGVDDRGRGVRLEIVDRRRSKEIETVDSGTVVIKKRKIKTSLGESFGGLEAFLVRQAADWIRTSREDD